jgi:cell division transport system ATP-binding protein
MISLRRVSKSYHANAQVLRNVNFDLKRGDFIFIIGDSGAGKSTLLKLMSGEEAPSEGAAVLEGQHALGVENEALRNFRRRLGIVHQDFRLLNDRTVFENIAMPLHFGRAGTGIARIPSSGGAARKVVENSLRLMDLPPSIQDVKVDLLSGGEKQRVAIARAVINLPDVLIADEPTGSLDHDHTWAVMDLFQKLNMKGMTIVVATHDRDIVRKVRRKTAHLTGGTLRVDEREGACIF